MFTRISLFAAAIPYSLFSSRHIPPIWAKRRPYVANAHRTNKQYDDTKCTGCSVSEAKYPESILHALLIFSHQKYQYHVQNDQRLNTANATLGKWRECSELPELRPKLHSRLIAIKAIIGLSRTLTIRAIGNHLLKSIYDGNRNICRLGLTYSL